MNGWWWLLCLLGVGAVQAADMTVLRYVEQDPGDPAYLTRILVTPDFMRMDGGENGGDFVLLDRHRLKVINVMRDNRMALVFSPGSLPPKPAGWAPRLEVSKAARGTQHYRFTVNGVMCSEGLAAKQASPDAARAMAEMKSVLAATQYRVWQEAPPELQHDCDLANQVWESGTTLKLGLPLKDREFNGKSRELESESKQPLRLELFRVPEGLAEINAPS